MKQIVFATVISFLALPAHAQNPNKLPPGPCVALRILFSDSDDFDDLALLTAEALSENQPQYVVILRQVEGLREQRREHRRRFLEIYCSD